MFIYCSSFIESHTPGGLPYPVFLIISLEAYLANTSKYKLTFLLYKPLTLKVIEE